MVKTYANKKAYEASDEEFKKLSKSFENNYYETIENEATKIENSTQNNSTSEKPKTEENIKTSKYSYSPEN
jgi:hypothetical protein